MPQRRTADEPCPHHPESRRRRDERGAVLVVVMILLVVICGMAAVTLDLGAKYAARRNAQSAVDIGLLSGAQKVPFGLPQASEAIESEIRRNLDAEFTDLEWRSMWSTANCSDPDRFETRGTVGGVATDCISFDDTGRARVRLPDLSVPTFFGSIFGVSEVDVTADAVAWVRYAGIGGVLPFTVLGGAEDGSQVCLRSASGGTAIPPCEGSEAGNFHALEISIYGDPAFQTETIACNTNKNDVFTINVAKGIDHLLRLYTDVGVTDSCAKPFGPNQFYTQTGLGNGLWEGFVAGETIQSVFFAGRLTNLEAGGSTIDLVHEGTTYTIDNTPLWTYIPHGLTAGDDLPASCLRETFDAMTVTAASANLETCLNDYDAGDGYVPLFTVDADGDGEYDINDNPRFAIVPQTVETTLPRGKKVVRVGGFRAVWIQGLYFPAGTPVIVEPGDPRTSVAVPSGGSPLDQVTGWLLPNSTVEAIIGVLDSAGGEVNGSNRIELEE